RFWDARTGEELGSLKGHTGITSIAFSPDGLSLATASGPPELELGGKGEVWLWDVKMRRQRAILPGTEVGGFFSVTFSPDNATLSAGCGDGTVKLWEARTGQERIALSCHSREVASVAFSPDGLTLASAGRDGRVCLWDPRAGQLRTILEPRNGEVTTV